MRVNFVLSEVATGLRRNLTMTVAMILTTAISLGLMGTGLLIAGMISEMKEIYYDKVQVSIFLTDDVTEEQRADIESRLTESPEVNAFLYESKQEADRKSTRLNSSHGYISYAVFCLKKKKKKEI